MNKKILVLDIDGTLTNSKKEITPTTLKALIRIQEMGHSVMLASGRPTPGMKRFASELCLEKFGGYLLSFNGGKIVNCKTEEVVYQKTLPTDVIPELYEFAKENDCGIITYRGNEVLSGTRMDEYIELETRINAMPVTEVDNFVECITFPVNKCLMTAPIEKAEQLEKILQEKYHNVLSVYRSEPFFIEIMPENVDKASSLDHMLPLIGLTKEDAICCGDGYNDITMIAYAGVGVAMANAREEVKKVADYITKSNDEDGLVEVIEKFVL